MVDDTSYNLNIVVMENGRGVRCALKRQHQDVKWVCYKHEHYANSGRREKTLLLPKNKKIEKLNSKASSDGQLFRPC